jgi:hypothetical protein
MLFGFSFTMNHRLMMHREIPAANAAFSWCQQWLRGRDRPLCARMLPRSEA